MRAKIENNLIIEVCSIDLTKLKNIEFYIKQGELFFQYTPQIIDEHRMTIKISYDEAMQFSPDTNAESQFAFTDIFGNKGASEITKIPVDDLINNDGYLGGGDEPDEPYEGDYNITPSLYNDIKLDTAGKTLEQDITVFKIPQEFEDNEAGQTLIIGKENA